MLLALLEERDNKIAEFRSRIRTVQLMLVGPPWREEEDEDEDEDDSCGPRRVPPFFGLDHEGLQIYATGDEDLPKDVDEDEYDFEFTQPIAMWRPFEDLKLSKVRFGDFFVTDLFPKDGSVSLTFGWRQEVDEWDANKFGLDWKYRIDVGLGDGKDDQITVDIELFPGRGSSDSPDYLFDAEDICKLAGIVVPQELSPGEALRSVGVDDEDYGFYKVPQLSNIPISKLEETFPGGVRFSIFQIVIPERVIRHKSHLL